MENGKKKIHLFAHLYVWVSFNLLTVFKTHVISSTSHLVEDVRELRVQARPVEAESLCTLSL